MREEVAANSGEQVFEAFFDIQIKVKILRLHGMNTIISFYEFN